ncbi:hypothetical protein B5S28_g4348 [[Candida] boidinii]|nr:hypothetical protein B5S28_g4348 [[Candida] boidinii]OWB63858.1 hypothetical protein B5S29_g4871 [[Candida] boidinii]
MSRFSKIFGSILHSNDSNSDSSSNIYSNGNSNTNNSNNDNSNNNYLRLKDEYHTDKLNKVIPNSPIKLSIKIESPPLMLYGPPESCSGAFFSGLLVLDVFNDDVKNLSSVLSNIENNNYTKSPILTPNKNVRNLYNVEPVASNTNANANLSELISNNNNDDIAPTISVSALTKDQLLNDYVELQSVTLSLIQIVTYGKPFVINSNTIQQCQDCNIKTTELATWNVLKKPTAFAKSSSHAYPFSYLIPGNLPPTTSLVNANTSIKYELICKCYYKDTRSSKKKYNELINISLPIIIRRSILRGNDRNSIRLFPPTDVTSQAVIPNVAYPKSTFPVEIRMDNVSSRDRRWRMRKLNWRIEECVRIKTNCCEIHRSKYNTVVETTKKNSKGKKIHKNSGGLNQPSINTFFEYPKKRTIPQIDNNQQQDQQNENGNGNHHPQDTEFQSQQLQTNNSINDSTNTTNSEGNSNNLSSFASNWSNHQVHSNSQSQQDTDDLNTVLVPPPPPSLQNQQHPSLDMAISNSLTQQSREPTSAQGLVSSTTNSSTSGIPLTDSTTTANNHNHSNEKVMYIEEIRTLSAGELKSGWKSDFSGKGRIETVVDIDIMNSVTSGLSTSLNNLSLINSQNCDSPIFNTDSFIKNSNCSCDIEDYELGIFVNHNLIVELVVAEEIMQPTNASHYQLKSAESSSSTATTGSSTTATTATATSTATSQSGSNSNNNSSTNLPAHKTGGTGPDHLTGNSSDPTNHSTGVPTGIARVLRMQFKIVITDRSGLGVSWDDEVPPTYSSVGALSPPTYNQATSGSNTPLIPQQSLVIPLDELELLDPISASNTNVNANTNANNSRSLNNLSGEHNQIVLNLDNMLHNNINESSSSTNSVPIESGRISPPSQARLHNNFRNNS